MINCNLLIVFKYHNVPHRVASRPSPHNAGVGPHRSVFHKEYLQTNVLGTIPYFEDLTVPGGPHGMTESCAVPLYLVTKHGTGPRAGSLGLGPDHPEYGDYLNWLMHADATLTFPQTVVLRYTVQEPGRQDLAAEDYGRWYVARLRKLNAALADGREFLVANRFTIADICIAYALYLGTSLKTGGEPLSARYKPQTAAYLERMMRRPGWAAAAAAQDASAARFTAEHGGGGGGSRNAGGDSKL